MYSNPSSLLLSLTLYADRLLPGMFLAGAVFFAHLWWKFFQLSVALGGTLGLVVGWVMLLMLWGGLKDWKYIRPGARVPVIHVSEGVLHYRDEFKVPLTAIQDVAEVWAGLGRHRRSWLFLTVATPEQWLINSTPKAVLTYRKLNGHLQPNDEPTRLRIDHWHLDSSTQTPAFLELLQSLKRPV